MTQLLEARRGPNDPTRATPLRRPGSVRRTATTDMLRPDGPGGSLRLVGRARDLRTDSDGSTEVLREAGATTVVAGQPRGSIVELRTTPRRPETQGLLGLRAGSGFRTALDDALAVERAARSPLFLLLDDVPVTALISGYALQAERDRSPMPHRALASTADICSGWRSDGTMMVLLRSGGSPPRLEGPEAPDIRSADPLGWHPLPVLAPAQMRRHRRLDVAVDPSEPGVLHAHAMFRDSYAKLSGVETIVHEYEVWARMDRASGRVLEVTAAPRVLPWPECPAAAASAERLVGTDISGLRAQVRNEFTGTSTCTHLNDALRSLEDVAALDADLPGK